ncbi:hypothetical protein AO069_04865 [Pseudomonas syringae pv. syringae PD2774]|nr:hypothetical protein AO069_04865 [Pseudomonas syringae pv. syringae PD2774]
MEESDNLDQVVVCHTIEHDMAWATVPWGVGPLACLGEVITAKARCKLTAVVAATGIRRAGKSLTP